MSSAEEQREEGRMSDKAIRFVGLMREAGWTQSETARRLRISRAAVSSIVNGRNHPSPSLLELLIHKVRARQVMRPDLADLVERIQSLDESEQLKAIEFWKLTLAQAERNNK